MIKRLIGFLFALMLFLPGLVHAADIRSGETLTISGETPLVNPYLAGSRVTVSSPVRNDLVVAGGTLELEGAVSEDIWAAGGDVEITGPVQGSVRVAGGNITIDSAIAEDLLLFGGSIRVSQDATIGGDLIFNGGQLEIDGPIAGSIRANGGELVINAPIGGDVEGSLGKLTLGENARIDGDLIYSAPEAAEVHEGAVIQGRTDFTEDKKTDRSKDAAPALFTAGTMYALIVDILFALLLIWLIPIFARKVSAEATNRPLRNLLLGFAALILFPLASLFLLFVFWIGLSMFFLYILLFFLTLGLMKVATGWRILVWWQGRKRKNYELDWKAGVLGPLVIALLGFIPVIGWLTIFIIFLLTFGALANELYALVTTQRTSPKTKRSV